MEIRVYRRAEGLFDVLTRHKRATGLPPVYSRNVKLEQITAVVGPIAAKDEEVLTEIKAARAGRRPA